MQDYSQFTKNQQNFLAALEITCGIVSEASNKCGISRNTHYDWMRTEPEYKAAVQEINELMIDLAESCLRKNMVNGDTSAATFLLRYKGKKRGYNDKQEIDVTVTQRIVDFQFGNLDPNKEDGADEPTSENNV